MDFSTTLFYAKQSAVVVAVVVVAAAADPIDQISLVDISFWVETVVVWRSFLHCAHKEIWRKKRKKFAANPI